MARAASTGKCFLCKGTFKRAAMTRHVGACLQERAASAERPAARPGKKAKCLHIWVEGRYLPQYWLYIEVPAKAKLSTLDQFLRDIWLECCGHMSAFTIGEQMYSVEPMEDYAEHDMNVALSALLAPGTAFLYEYDFGTTTDLKLRILSEAEGKLQGNAIRLLARNHPPEIPCGKCGKPATKVCPFCVHDAGGWLCNACAPKHKCEDDVFLPVVNSPRTGMCAYTGREAGEMA